MFQDIGNIFRISTKSGASWSDQYYHYDAIGNVVYISDFDGTPSYAFDQEAYGNVKVGSQSGYHLTTKEYDSIPELYYFWQRWYDPVLGIFISASPFPLYIEGSYIICANNMINKFDSRGLYPTPQPLPTPPISDPVTVPLPITTPSPISMPIPIPIPTPTRTPGPIIVPPPTIGPPTPIYIPGIGHYINPPHCPFYRIAMLYHCWVNFLDWGYESYWECYYDYTTCPYCQ